MKEIEIFVEVYDDIEKVRKSLKKYKYHTIDEYYYDPLRKTLKPGTEYTRGKGTTTDPYIVGTN